MNINLKVAFFAILLIKLSTQISYSQVTTSKGYLVLNNNDTIRGYLENLDDEFLDKVLFVKENTNDIAYYFANQIKQVYIQPDTYLESKDFGKDTVLFKVLSEGKLSLYKHKKDFFITCGTDSLIKLIGGKYLVESSNKTYYTDSKTYKIQIKQCLNDANYFEKVDKLFFKEKNIVALFNELNQVAEPSDEAPKLKKYHNPNHLGIEISTGKSAYGLYNQQITDYSEQIELDDPIFQSSFNIYNSKYLGLNYKRNVGKSSSSLSFSLAFSKASDKSYTKTGVFQSTEMMVNENLPDSIGQIVDTYNINLNALDFSFTYYRELSAKTVRPVIDVGIAGKYLINSQIESTRDIYVDDTYIKSKNYTSDQKTLYFRATASLGVCYKISMKDAIIFRGVWEGTLPGMIGNVVILKAVVAYNFM